MELIDRLLTPIKKDSLVIKPSYRKNTFDSHLIDCPFLFRNDGKYYMTYVGWDTIGYRTGLASSADLLNWKKEGMILDRGPQGSATEFNVAMTCILRDNDLFGSGELKKINGQYVGTYHAYPGAGYEAGPGAIGICYSQDLRNWTLDDPVLRAQDGDEWECGGLYKSWIMEHEGRYFLFYNAKNRAEGWIEQTGVASSNDLKSWTRYTCNPILTIGKKEEFDDCYASDPCVLRSDDTWVMFYFGNCTDGHAREGAAFSNDLLKWTKLDRILVDIGQPGSVDSCYAHKPGIISKGNHLYHFYCAVSPNPQKKCGEVEVDEFRGIGLAFN